MNGKVCSNCQSIISPLQKQCPVCENSIRTGFFSKILKVFFYFMIAMVMISILSAILNTDANHDENGIKSLIPQEIEYENAIQLDYRAALLKDIPENSLTLFKGEVKQITGDKNILFSSKQIFGNYADDDIFLFFHETPRIVEGDIVEIKARYDGTFTYETVLRANKTIPKYKVDYYKVIQNR